MKHKIITTQIQNTNLTSGVKKMAEKANTYTDSFYKMLKDLIARAEREVPEYGDFTPVFENFKNTNPNLDVDRYQLKIFKMPKAQVADETRRFLEAEVYTKAGIYKANMLLGEGSKKDIMKQIKSEDFVEKLNNAYIQLVDLIQNP